MTSRRYKIVGLGELLWDLLPAGKQLGGAPANFAYISTLLGNEGIVASRLGCDPLGDEAARQLSAVGVNADSIQRDTSHPTGTVRVEVDAAGQPKFEIGEGVAWDYLEWTSAWEKLAAEADAVCFGSLAQRADVSRATIRKFVSIARKGAVRVFDVNLRQSFYSKEVLTESIQVSDIVKLNHEELPRIMELFGVPHRDEIASAESLVERYQLKMICVTRGCRGSLLIRDRTVNEHPGYRVRVADTVGAGDAFTAGLVREYLRRAPLAAINESANRVGAWVASNAGAMPVPGSAGLERELAVIE
ncbi:MAG TPA: carbohydrate kinase [Terriglobales bacterium]|nr:carbohydrate kinase [Terriglobales bacterium]